MRLTKLKRAPLSQLMVVIKWKTPYSHGEMCIDWNWYFNNMKKIDKLFKDCDLEITSRKKTEEDE